jgi:transposase InsO family protein
MAITIGAKEGKAKENRMTNSLRSVSKMRIIRTGVSMEVLGFTLNYRIRAFKMARKRVARLMQEHGLSARKKKRKPRTTDSHHDLPIAPNLLEQDFTADAPDKKWMSDFTYLETREGWLYLAGVIDAYSRKIVGWSMSEHHDAELVHAALHMALLQRQPGAELIHHSDRGSEYASIRYQSLLREHQIQISMSKKGACYDNAMIESFWATLKSECSRESIFSSRNEAKKTVFEYIEVYYVRSVQPKLAVTSEGMIGREITPDNS